MISIKLREWYRANKRDLPWRKSSDPYIIWISEIMLQQTRVAQGHDYFLRFTERFPDIQALASAQEDEVLKHWEGLGYYSRARNLHSAAKYIVSAHGGIFPADYKEVLSLKGIGEYTAAAIVSLAWNQPYAVVDGNVYRVLSRLFGLKTPVDTGKGKKDFYELATQVLDKNHAGEHNQAIMEFGALFCTPRNPDCPDCIFTDTCYAYSAGKVDVLPMKQGKTKIRHRYLNYFHVKCGTDTYLHKRSASDIWRGLYEFPLIETEVAADFAKLQQTTEFKDFFPDSERIVIKTILPEIKHVLSHQILHATFYEIEVPETGKILNRFLRIPDKNLNEYAIPRLLHIYFEKRDGKLAE